MKPEDLTVISPNMIKVFEDCPLKFYHRYIEQISTPILDKTFVVGKNIHAMACYYLKKSDISKLETALTETEKGLWGALKSNPYFGYETVGVEKSLTMRFGDYWLGGRIDALVKRGKNYYILDYKTGGVNGDMVFDPQTMVYLMMCEEWLKDYDQLSFVYLDLKNKNEVKIPFSKELKQIYSEKLMKVCDNITKFNYRNPKIEKECECEYYNLCKPLL